MFKAKVVPYSCNQHNSKGTTFTLKVNSLCFRVALHVPLPLDTEFADNFVSYMQTVGNQSNSTVYLFANKFSSKTVAAPANAHKQVNLEHTLFPNNT